MPERHNGENGACQRGTTRRILLSSLSHNGAHTAQPSVTTVRRVLPAPMVRRVLPAPMVRRVCLRSPVCEECVSALPSAKSPPSLRFLSLKSYNPATESAVVQGRSELATPRFTVGGGKRAALLSPVSLLVLPHPALARCPVNGAHS